MAEKYAAKLTNGEVITLEKECECVIHDEPHWIHLDRLLKKLNEPLFELILKSDVLAVRVYAVKENARLKEKIRQMEQQKIVEIIVPEKVMIQDEKIKKSEKFIKHLVSQIRSNSKLRYEIGEGTQTLDLLVDAASVLFNETPESIRDYCLPTEQPLKSAAAVDTFPPPARSVAVSK